MSTTDHFLFTDWPKRLLQTWYQWLPTYKKHVIFLSLTGQKDYGKLDFGGYQHDNNKSLSFHWLANKTILAWYWWLPTCQQHVNNTSFSFHWLANKTMINLISVATKLSTNSYFLFTDWPERPQILYIGGYQYVNNKLFSFHD